MSHRVNLFALILWLFAPTLPAEPPSAAADPDGGAVAGTQPTSTVELRNGQLLQGTVLNESFTFHTAYGSLPLEINMIARLEFDIGLEHKDLLVTLNGSRLTGYANDLIRLQDAQGEETSLAKPMLLALTRRGTQASPPSTSTSQVLFLATGDQLSGSILTPEITISTASGKKTFPISSLETIRVSGFDRDSKAADLQFRDGEELSGTLAMEALKYQLDDGPEILLSWSHVKTLYCRPGFLPSNFGGSRDPFRSTEEEPPVDLEDPNLVWIRPGAFLMGSPPDESGRGWDEGPQTKVILTRGFWMGRYEVTQSEYLAIMGTNPSGFQGEANRPVEKVSWHEAREYCSKLTATHRQAGRLPEGYVYRLPTEAEWEYACRAGTNSRFSYGEDPEGTGLVDHAWFLENSNSTTHSVGSLKPNPWGLHDMHGNVWEWCQDTGHETYPGGVITNSSGSGEGWLRVARGGSWLYDQAFCRSANRDTYGPNNRCNDLGFRILLAP